MTKTKATHATDPNAQTAKAQEGGQATQQTDTGAVTAAAGAGPAVATAQASSAHPAQRDENTGHGGRYVRLKDGTRVLEERTLSESEHAKAEAAKATAQAQAH